MSLFRTKSVDRILEDAGSGEGQLARRLTALDLIMLGIGVIIGAGIFVITGAAAADKAGPAIVLSFVLSGIGCALAGFCYAEMASMIPISGSAYTYSYATLGEIFAWIIGWDLILEYAVGAITVAIGWSGYFVELLRGYGLEIPYAYCHGPFEHDPVTHAAGFVNVPALVLVILVTILLVVGIKESARATTVVVIIKLVVIFAFLALGIPWVRPANWSPFMPYGWHGILAGAGVIFFAYIGFDALSTAAEETINPQRDLPIGILGSLGFCTVLYIVVALVLTGMVPYLEFHNQAAPVAFALQHVGVTWGMKLVSIGAVCGLSSVVLVLMMGQPRIFFAMSRDGLISPWISQVHPVFHTPYRSTILTGVFVMICAGVIPIGVAGELTSIGTLFAFVLVCLGVLVLRYKRPDLKRNFRAPFVPYVPVAGALICLAMMAGLGGYTWLRFVVWLIIGLVLYFTYGRNHALVATEWRDRQDAGATGIDGHEDMTLDP
jgi:APA family basic amino acid/polyamine antiporter